MSWEYSETVFWVVGEHIRLDRGEIFCCWLEDEGREEA